MNRTEVLDLAQQLGPWLKERASAADHTGQFVEENYAELKRRSVFSIMVPKELGGGGASHSDVCALLSLLAESCASTALSLSMHQHLIAAAVFRYRNGQPGEQLLRKVAAEQAVLVSTGAGDWLDSNGQAVPVEGGYRVSARKAFSSGSPQGDLLVTSAVRSNPGAPATVLHFAVPLRADGVRLLQDWDALGMRGTGSHSVQLENVFVPQTSVVLERPQGVWHMMWNVTLCVAAPIYMAPYLGVARAAAAIARHECQRRRQEAVVPYLIGELENSLTAAELSHASMVALTNELQFKPSVELTSAMLARKTLLTRAVREVTHKAMEAVGGQAYFRRLGLERLLRDAEASQYHPLAEKPQQLFTGRVALGMDPVLDPPVNAG